MNGHLSRRGALQRLGASATILACRSFSSAAARSAHPGQLIDFHVHLTQGWTGTEAEPITPAHLVDWMNAHGVERAVVLPLVSPEAFWYPVSTEFVLTETASLRDRLIPFCAVDPRTLATHLATQEQLIELLTRYRDAGCKGFGEHKPRLAIDDPLNMRLYEACASVNLLVLFHLDNQANMDEPGLPGLNRALTAFPNLTFIGHGKGWWASIAGGVSQADLHVGYPRGAVAPGGAVDALMDRHANLYGDLSSGGAHALLRDPPFGREFVRRRADRLLFGTDYYDRVQVDLPHFRMFDDLDATSDVRQKVGRTNAMRLLQLPD